MRLNGHRSDVKVKPKACELAQHFHGSHECDMKKDLKVYILQDNVIGSHEKKNFMKIFGQQDSTRNLPME